MIAFFPDPYPEELLYSVIARYQERVMVIDRKAALLDLFGTLNALAVIALPSHLGALVANLPPGNPYTPEILIKQNTLLPYFAPFLERNQLESIMADMIGERGSAVAGRAGLMASTVKDPTTLQFCPCCVEADRKQYGEAYWHRVHQLPGVCCCPHHHVTMLLNSKVSTHNARTRHGFVTLEAVLRSQEEALEEVADQRSPVQKFIAQESQRLLANWMPSLGFEVLQGCYITALQEKDLALPSGRARARELVTGIIDYFGCDFLRQYGCDLPDDSEHTWVLRMVRRPKGSQHPLKHLLLLHFLGLDVDTFLKDGAHKSEKKHQSWPCLNPAANHYGRPVIPAPRKTYRRTNGNTYGIFACDCGFSYRCPLDDDPFAKARVLTFGALWEDLLRELNQMPGVSLLEAARTLKVDPGTIHNHATRLNLSRWAKPGSVKELLVPCRDLHLIHRRTWMKHKKDNPDKSRTELRCTLPGIYTWLYRHDREWLQEHQPEPRQKVPDFQTRVNWDVRDGTLVSRVATVVEQLKMRSDPLIRASATAVGRELGCLSWLQKHPEKIPKTRDRINNLAEDRMAFACRRLLHTWDGFNAAGIRPKAWELLREARIRDDISKHPVIQSLIERLGAEGGGDDIFGASCH
jgi:hypothetical protein